jgi:putative peptidoglycan lipid II flippase
MVSLKIGTSLDLDLYYLVIGLIGVICGIIVTQESYFIVPKGLLIKSKLGLKSFVAYYNKIFVVYGVLMLTIAFLYFLFTIPLVDVVSKYNNNEIDKSIILLKLLSIYLFFTPVNTLAGNILNSLNYYRISTFVTLSSSLLIVLCIFLFDNLGTASLYIGASLSSFGAFAFYFIFLRIKGWTFSLSYKRTNFRISNNIYYANGMALLSYLKGLLNNYIISGMGNGVLTGFNFGYGLHNMPTFLLLSQIKIPFSVRIAELFHENKLKELNEYTNWMLLILIHLTIPINLIFYQFSDQIVDLLYGHGKFDTRTINSISEVFGNLSFTIPLSVFESFIFQIFISLNGLQIISKYTVINNFALLAFNIFGLTYWGLKGFAISMVLMYLLMSVYLIYFSAKIYSFLRLHIVFLQYIALLLVSFAIMILCIKLCENMYCQNLAFMLFIKISVFVFLYMVLIYFWNIGGKIRYFINDLAGVILRKLH